MLKHYVTAMSPNAFCADSSEYEVMTRNNPAEVAEMLDEKVKSKKGHPYGYYCFYYWDREETEVDGEVLKGKEKNRSGAYFVNAEVFSQVTIKLHPKCTHTLEENMRCNDYKYVAQQIGGPIWFQPFDEKCYNVVKNGDAWKVFGFDEVIKDIPKE